MNKFELLCIMIVLFVDVFVIMSLGTGEKITQLWTSVLLFVNGFSIGNIFYVIALQDLIQKKFNI